MFRIKAPRQCFITIVAHGVGTFRIRKEKKIKVILEGRRKGVKCNNLYSWIK